MEGREGVPLHALFRFIASTLAVLCHHLGKRHHHIALLIPQRLRRQRSGLFSCRKPPSGAAKAFWGVRHWGSAEGPEYCWCKVADWKNMALPVF